jgi:peptidoglycan/LPS O-acetylase OafA/YrhL
MRYEPSLDGLRAFSVLSVVFYHISENWMPGGWAGVDTFFVLSGYLITSLLAREMDETGTIRFGRFYIRRVLRLGPALGCLLAFIVFAALFTPFSERRVELLRGAAISLVYMMNWSRAFAWFPPWVLDHTWSLSMEEQFYLLWPALFLFFKRGRPVLWLTLTLVIVTTWRVFLASTGAEPERTYNGFDTHSDGLLLGCVIALLPRLRLGAVASKSIVIPVAGLISIFFFLQFRTYFTQTAGLSISAVLSAWIILALEQDNWLKKFLSMKPLVYTGRLSYGWYLWHFPLIRMARYTLQRMHLSANGGADWIGFNCALVVVSYVVAMLSFEFVETPFLRLKNRGNLQIAGNRSVITP